LLATAAGTAWFQNTAQPAGIRFLHRASKTPRKLLPETMGGGVAALDYDRDGWIDLFFVNGARLEPGMAQGSEPDKSDPAFWNRMFRNNGDGTFRDVTAELGLAGRGYGMGVAVGDADNDGFPDLVVTNAATGDAPALIYYRNRGGKRFEETTEPSGLRARGWATSAGFLDYNNDGNLDLFVCRYLDWRFDQDHGCGLETPQGRSYCHPDLFRPVTNLLYRNNGNGTFSDVTAASGIGSHAGKGLGVAFADFDGDGWMDIAVANDSHPQFLFRNEGNGGFREIALGAGAAYDENGAVFAGMGISTDDLDDDGRPDLLITTLAQQRFAIFFNQGGNQFEYASDASGLARITKLRSGWGVNAADFDNDGRKEMFLATGHVMDNIERSQPHVRYLEPPLLLRFDGRRITDLSATGGPLFGQPRWRRRYRGLESEWGGLHREEPSDARTVDWRGCARMRDEPRGDWREDSLDALRRQKELCDGKPGGELFIVSGSEGILWFRGNGNGQGTADRVAGRSPEVDCRSGCESDLDGMGTGGS
jgi:enediyne biosynthesis protein E4